MERPRILVLAGDDTLREAIAKSVGLLGAEAHPARDAGEALDRLAAGQVPDALLLDMGMPLAHAFLSTLRSRPRLADVPVLTISSGTPLPIGPPPTGLRWPFDVDELSRILVSLCDAPKGPAGDAPDAPQPRSRS